MLQKITKTQRLVCFALAATVVFQVPMMKIGSDKARPFTPVSVVASQLALPIPDAPGKPGDPGDLLRAIMYPGELVWGAWDAYVCATCGIEPIGAVGAWPSAGRSVAPRASPTKRGQSSTSGQIGRTLPGAWSAAGT